MLPVWIVVPFGPISTLMLCVLALSVPGPPLVSAVTVPVSLWPWWLLGAMRRALVANGLSRSRSARLPPWSFPPPPPPPPFPPFPPFPPLPPPLLVGVGVG